MNILIIFIFFRYSLNENTTIFVFEHTRHGARAPTHFDIFNHKWIGTGELTLVGQRMHYLLGVHNKNIYGKYYNKTFNPNEFLIYSTTLNRTIMSVNSQLNGWFPYENSEKINKNQIEKAIPHYLKSNIKIKKIVDQLGDNVIINGVQVFPIHTLNENDEQFKYNINCPKINDLRKENSIRLGKELDKFNNHFIETFGNNLSKIFNPKSNNSLNRFREIYNFCDEFRGLYYEGRDINIDNLNLTKLNEECDKNHDFRFLNLSIHDKGSRIGIFKSGNFMKLILYYMEQRIKLDEKIIKKGAPKFLIFSGHDSTLSEMQDFLNAAFGNFSYNSPNFASNLFFEVINVNKTKLIVNVIFNDKLIMSEDYNIFKEKVKKKIMNEKEIVEFCFPNSIRKIVKYLYIVFIGLDLIFIIIIIIMKKKEKNINIIYFDDDLDDKIQLSAISI